MRRLLLLAAALLFASAAFAQGGFGPGSSTGSSVSSPATTIDVVSPTYGVKPDGKMCNDVVISGAPLRTVTSAANCTFTAADVGKEAMAFITTCDTNGVSGQTDVLPTGTTIATFVSAHVVTLSATATSSGFCFAYGTNNDAAMTLVDTAITNSTQCPQVQLPVGMIVVDAPHLTQGVQPQEPNSCSFLPVVHGASAEGGGMTVRGYGSGVSGFWLGNSFNANMATKCTNGTLGTSCWFLQGSNEWHDFGISGLGETGSSLTPGNHFLLEVYGYSVLENMSFSNYDMQSGSSNQVQTTGNGLPIRIINTSFDGFGKLIGITNLVYMSNSVIQDYCINPMIQVAVGALFDVTGGFNDILTGKCTGTNASLVQLLGTMTGSGQIFMGIANGNTNPVIGINIGAAGILDVNNLYLNGVSGNAGSIGIQNLTGAGIAKIANSQIINWPVAALAYKANQGAFFDGCNNTIPGMTLSGTALVFGSCSVTGTALVTGNVGLTSGWGTSSVASVAAGSDSHRGRFTITGAAGAASPTLTLTFPTAFFQAPASCTLTENTTDIASLTSVAAGAPTTTNILFTFAGTPIAVTYIFDYQCGP